MIHRFRIYGTVRGQGRPRFKKFGKTYKDKKDEKWENAIKEAYINSNGINFGSKPLVMIALIHRRLPDSKPKYVESEMDVYKPDADNIFKGIADALNGIAYDDDKQIVAAIPIKMPRARRDGEYIDVLISDETDIYKLTNKIMEVFE